MVRTEMTSKLASKALGGGRGGAHCPNYPAPQNGSITKALAGPPTWPMRGVLRLCFSERCLHTARHQDSVAKEEGV